MAHTIQWHSVSADRACRMLRSDPRKGLTRQEVKKRKARRGNGSVWRISQNSYFSRWGRVITDAVSAVLLLSVLISYLISRSGQGLAILLLLLFGTAFRFSLYYFSNRQFEKAVGRVLPRVRVIRDGRTLSVSFTSVVEGDIVLLDAGDMIPCDLRLLKSERLVTDESSLSFPVHVLKSTETVDENTAPEQCTDLLYASTSVVSGSACGVAVATGHRTYVSRVHGGIAWHIGDRTPTLDKLEIYGKYLSLGSLFLVAVITFLGLLNDEGAYSVLDIFVSAIAYCVAVSAESLTIAGRFSLALSMKRSASQHTFIKDPSVTEKIGETDCLLISDLALLKSGRKRIGTYFADGSLADPGGKPFSAKQKSQALSDLLEWACISQGELPESVLESRENEDEQAALIRKLYQQYGKTRRMRSVAGRSVADSVSFSGLHVSLLNDAHQVTLVASGKMEDVLARCTRLRAEGKNIPLRREAETRIRNAAEACRNRSVALVGVAVRSSPVSSLIHPSAICQEMCFLGFFAITEEIPEEVSSYLRKIQQEKISLVVLSESSPLDRWFATDSGLLSSKDFIIGPASDVRCLQRLRPGASALLQISPEESSPERVENAVECLKASGFSVTWIGESISSFLPSGVDTVMAINPKTKEEMAQAQTLGSLADAMVTHGDNAGILHSVMETVAITRNGNLNMWHVWHYLAASAMSKTVLMLLSALSVLPMISAVPLLVWGLILDMVAALAIVYNGRPSYIYQVEMKRINRFGVWSVLQFPVILGVLWSVLSLLVPVVQGSEGGVAFSQIWVSLNLGLLAAVAELMQNEGIFQSRNHFGLPLTVLCAVTILSTSLMLLSDSFAALLGGVRLSGKEAVLSILPALLMIVCSEIYKKIIRDKNDSL